MYAEEQESYENLPAVIDEVGVTWTRWELSGEERRAIVDGAGIELLLWTFGLPLQPVYMRVEGVEEPIEVADITEPVNDGHTKSEPEPASEPE